jgi:hypothetical protein
MRTMSVLVLAVLAAACGPESSDEAEAPAAAVEAPSEPRAAQTAGMRFDALSKTAESFTGGISLSVLEPASPDDPPAMRLESDFGHIYETDLLPGGAEQAAVDWSAIFNTPIDLASRADGAPSVDVHIVASETIPPVAPNGGLCGREPVYAIAMATPLQMPGGTVLGIAAFSGDQWPPVSETALCGTFNYAPPG